MNKKFVTGTLAACGVYEIALGIWTLFGSIYLWTHNIRNIGGSERQSNTVRILMLGFYRNIAVAIACAVLLMLTVSALRFLKHSVVSEDKDGETLSKKLFIYCTLGFQFCFFAFRNLRNAYNTWAYKASQEWGYASEFVVNELRKMLMFTYAEWLVCFVILLMIIAACIFMAKIRFFENNEQAF